MKTNRYAVVNQYSAEKTRRSMDVKAERYKKGPEWRYLRVIFTFCQSGLHYFVSTRRPTFFCVDPTCFYTFYDFFMPVLCFLFIVLFVASFSLAHFRGVTESSDLRVRILNWKISVFSKYTLFVQHIMSVSR